MTGDGHTSDTVLITQIVERIGPFGREKPVWGPTTRAGEEMAHSWSPQGRGLTSHTYWPSNLSVDLIASVTICCIKSKIKLARNSLSIWQNDDDLAALRPAGVVEKHDAVASRTETGNLSIARPSTLHAQATYITVTGQKHVRECLARNEIRQGRRSRAALCNVTT